MRFIISFLGLLCCVLPVRADVRLHGLFTDHMVLQQGMGVPVWGTADPGETVTVRMQGQTAASTADGQGRWVVRLQPLAVGGPFELQVTGKNTLTLKDVLVGEVWVCSGQSNMEWQLQWIRDGKNPEFMAKTGNDRLRLFQHKKVTSSSPQTSVTTENHWTQWKVCGPDTLKDFSAVAYFFGRKLQHELNVPVGLIHTSWGGTPAEAWTAAEFLEQHPDLAHYATTYATRMKNYRANNDQMMNTYRSQLKKWEEDSARAKAENRAAPNRPAAPADPEKNPNSPSVLYNAMIHPLLPFAIRGAIWYQGESNAGRAYEYRTLFPRMIQSWREAWGYEFPFYFVQLAPWKAIKEEPQESDWAELREAQYFTSRVLPQTGMAVITDTTDAATDQKDIHPQNKAPVGERLALLALRNTYNRPVAANGPVYDYAMFAGNRAEIHFRSAESGLVARGEKLTGFTMAGPDRKFYRANAVIDGDKIVVTAAEVSEPAAVRFGWADYPVVNLFNKNGLPATPFRTDSWPGVTGPKPANK